MYLAGIEFNDINSEFLDDEIQCLDDATKDAISTRRKQLEQIVSTGRSNAQQLMNTAQWSKTTQA